MAQPLYEPADAAEAATATYRPLHPFAIPSLALAAAGLIGIWWPLAAIISIFALALAVVAFVQAARRPEDYSGKRLAGAAILLAGFTIGFAPVRSAVEQNYLFESARRAGDDWLRLLAEDRLREAHQLTLPATARQPADADLEVYYSTPLTPEERQKAQNESPDPAIDPKEILARYAQEDLIRQAIASDSFEAEFRGRRRHIEDGMNQLRYLDLAYDLRFDGSESVVPAILHLERREIPGQQIATWRIISLEREKD